MPRTVGQKEARVDEGEFNVNDQELVRRIAARSTTHPFAKIWVMRCKRCHLEYGSNSCDAHIRKCPSCEPTAAPAEPT